MGDLKSYNPEYMGEIMTECKEGFGDWYNREDADSVIAELEAKVLKLEQQKGSLAGKLRKYRNIGAVVK